MRKVLGIEYKGTRYFGWQKQKKFITVQGELEKALKKFLSKNKVETFGSGRTDTGVHASSQVVHFDTDIKRPKRSWIKGLNSLLPDDISVHSVFDTHDEFHSRFSAIDRSYRYIIYNGPFRKSLFADYFCWYPNSLLDEKKMQLCDKYLLGEKNFSSFRSSGCQSHSSTRKIKKFKVFRKDDYIYIDIKADSFLYNMVRNIVGSLCLVGEGKKSTYWFNDLVKKENRIYGGKKFPASGLHLVEIRYPKRFNIDIRRKLPTF